MDAIYQKEEQHEEIKQNANYAARLKELQECKELKELHEKYKIVDGCLIDLSTGDIIIDYRKGERYTEPLNLCEWQQDPDFRFVIKGDCLIDTSTGNVIMESKKCKRTRTINGKFANSYYTSTKETKKYDESKSAEELKKLCVGYFDNDRAKLEINTGLIDDLCLEHNLITNAQSAHLKKLCKMIQRRNVFILPKKTVESQISKNKVKLTRTLNTLRDKKCLDYKSTGLHETGVIRVVINPSFAWKGFYRDRQIEQGLWLLGQKYDHYANACEIIKNDSSTDYAVLDYETCKFAKKENTKNVKFANFEDKNTKIETHYEYATAA